MKKRIAALSTAVFLLIVICVVPAAALGDVPGLSRRYVHYDDKTAYKGQQVFDTLNLPELTEAESIADPYVYSWSTISLDFNDAKDWSYVAYEVSFDQKEVWGEYAVGFYRRTSDGKTMVRLGHSVTMYDSDLKTLVPDNDWPFEAPVSDGVKTICASIRIFRASNGVNLVLSYFGIGADGKTVVQHGQHSAVISSVVTAINISDKCNYAAYGATLIDPATVYPHDISDLMAYDVLAVQWAADRYSDGFDSGYYEGVIYGREQAENDINNVQKSIWNIMSMPVDILANVLNFDFLGINIWALASGLFTVALIIFVLKKVGVF